MTSRHTPAPWVTSRAKYNGDMAIIASAGAIIAECFEDMRSATEHNKAECEANARLIAAAPELLTALEEIVVDLQFSEVEQHRKLVDIARTAIERATGEEARL